MDLDWTLPLLRCNWSKMRGDQGERALAGTSSERGGMAWQPGMASLGLTAVQQRRGLLISAAKAEYQRDRNRRLLDLLKECNPSVFWWLLETAASRWPDEFSSPGRKDHKNGPDADHHVGSRPGPTVGPGVCPHDP
jgi:hypothetical protein